jgi:DNA topoisomerase-1
MRVLISRAVVDGDPIAAAGAAALHYASDAAPGFQRKRHGSGFRYLSNTGSPLRDRATVARIRSLAIPPAWTAVWIAADPNAHLQATGRDARGRKQYRYHPRWRGVRDEAKFHRFVDFCRVLPQLRARVTADLACPCLCKAKVVATIIALMECAQLRVGNDAYTRDNGSYGATTLRTRHVRLHGDIVELAYRGKSGVARRVRISDRRLANIVRRCRELPGQRLFQYVDDDGVHAITSSDVNDYMHASTDGPFTAKDYRTWAATLGMALLLCKHPPQPDARARNRSVKAAIARVAERLGHTPTVCRASYIHPRLIEDFSSGSIAPLAKRIHRRAKTDTIDVASLRAIEPIVARYLDAP